MQRVTNREMGVCVARREEFNNSHETAYGRWLGPEGVEGSRYVAYSYGTHFPMFIFDETAGYWVGNSDRYSPTTSCHQRACEPADVRHWLSTGKMKAIADRGVVGHIVDLFQHAA